MTRKKLRRRIDGMNNVELIIQRTSNVAAIPTDHHPTCMVGLPKMRRLTG